MAKLSTLEHAKTLGNSQISIFSTLASTLAIRGKVDKNAAQTSAVHRQAAAVARQRFEKNAPVL
jgi:hypothetical protein